MQTLGGASIGMHRMRERLILIARGENRRTHRPPFCCCFPLRPITAKGRTCSLLVARGQAGHGTQSDPAAGGTLRRGYPAVILPLAKGVFHPAEQLLEAAFGFLLLALSFQPGIAGYLAQGFLHSSFGLFGCARDAILVHDGWSFPTGLKHWRRKLLRT